MPYWIQEMEVAEHVSPDCTFHLIQDLLNLGTTSNSLNMKLDIFTGQAEEIRCDVLDVFVSETNCEVHFFLSFFHHVLCVLDNPVLNQ